MKKFLTSLLAIAMIFTSATCSFAGAGDAPVQKYTLDWGEYFTQEARTVDCYYTDSYFNESSAKYNNHLASASMAMSLTGTRDVYSTNAIDAFTQIGCTYIKWVERSGSRAVVYGKKVLESGATLIAVNTKATYGFCEWDNNVFFGSKGDVAGYTDICDATYEALVKYAEEDKAIAGTKNVKFWIMGHSRGGAIANMVAKKLSDKYGKKNVFAYCFDNPLTTTKKLFNRAYTNIHNVEIDDSGASVLIPEYMGFDRYGKVDKVFTSRNGKDKEMIAMLNKISSIDYWSGSDFRWAKIDRNVIDYLGVLKGKDIKEIFIKEGNKAPQEEFWKQALKLMKQVIPSRKAFTQNVSANAKAAARKLGYSANEAYTMERAARSFAIYLYDIIQFKDSPEHPENLLVIGGKNILKSKKLASLVLQISPVVLGKTPSMLNCPSKYAKWVDTLWNESKLESIMPPDQQKDAKLMLATFLELAIKLVKCDFNNSHQIIGTALYNTHRLYDCHVPVSTMAYLMANDSYYTNEGHAAAKTLEK